MNKILLSLLVYSGLGAITMLASVIFPNNIIYTYNSINSSGGTSTLSTSVNEIVPMNNSPAEGIFALSNKVSLGSVVADMESILIPCKPLHASLAIGGTSFDVTKSMVTGCNNQGDLYVIA